MSNSRFHTPHPPTHPPPGLPQRLHPHLSGRVGRPQPDRDHRPRRHHGRGRRHNRQHRRPCGVHGGGGDRGAPAGDAHQREDGWGELWPLGAGGLLLLVVSGGGWVFGSGGWLGLKWTAGGWMHTIKRRLANKARLLTSSAPHPPSHIIPAVCRRRHVSALWAPLNLGGAAVESSGGGGGGGGSSRSRFGSCQVSCPVPPCRRAPRPSLLAECAGRQRSIGHGRKRVGGGPKGCLHFFFEPHKLAQVRG
jgi:hypothetical protein